MLAFPTAIFEPSRGASRMPITRQPKPLPSPLTYIPPASVPYKVTDNDSFYTLASRADMKARGVSASDLCLFNFKTRDPHEINWYLYNKVGCRKMTHDGSNYLFSSNDRPGIIYVPTATIAAQPDQPLNAWFGLGAKAGTQFVVVGIETIAGWLFSLDEAGKGMTVTSSVNRVGPGFGAGLGLCFIFISGVKIPQQLNGWQQLDWDFNLALGENWGKLAQGTAKVRKLKPLIDFVTKTGARSPRALKSALRADPDRWVDLVKQTRSFKESLALNSNEGPNVFMFDVPFISCGAEVSLFYGLSNFNALYDNI
jgi:hypothetical protein